MTIEQIKKNSLYITWFCVYFSISWAMWGFSLFGLFITMCMYMLSIRIALSELGEKLLKFLNNARRLATKKEKEYIIPIFEEVYTQAKKAYPDISRDIEICIVDTMNINAFALGRHTVAVTRGAIESLSDDEIKGFIAHELGHIYNGDTIAVLLTIIGNGIFTIFIAISTYIMNMIEIVTSLVERKGIVKFCIVVARIMAQMVLLAFVYMGQAILAVNSRSGEYLADRFAYDTGYGENLVESLYLLQGMSISSKSKLVDKLTASHPHIAFRIEAIEELIDEKGNSNTEHRNDSDVRDSIDDLSSDDLYSDYYDGYNGEDIDEYIEETAEDEPE